MRAASLMTIARRLNFIRETDGPNRGAWVEMLQRFCDGVPGDSWCSDFVCFVEDIAYRGRSPSKRTGSTQVKLAHAKAKGWITTKPQAEDLFFYVNDAGVPHHVGIVTQAIPLTGIAGNTSEDGKSSNGNGVFEHVLNVAPNHIVFVRLPSVVG
jgi:hypothetical protein